MDDVELTFNPNMFLQGVNKLTGSMIQLESSMKKFGTSGNAKMKSVNVSALSLLKGFTLIQGAVGLVRKAMTKIPEIGRSISIAGDIIMKNLLWPLRKELIPILQKMLDWVRDNRAMFVKWGMVVLNIFRILKSFVMGVFNLVKRIWQSFAKSMSDIFGKSQQSISDLANLVLFKISAVISFITVSLEPVAEFIGKIFAVMAKSGKAWLEGLTKSMNNFLPVMGEIWNGWKNIANALGLSSAKGETLIRVFRTLGTVVGSIVMPALRAVATVLDTVATSIRMVSLESQLDKAMKSGNEKLVNQILLQRKLLRKQFVDSQKKRWGQQGKEWKSAVGDIKETWGVTTPQVPEKDKEILRPKFLVIPGGKGVPKGKVEKRSNTNNSNTYNDNRKDQNINVTQNIYESKDPRNTGKEATKSLFEVLQEQKFRSGR
jgi:hypothetical protein